MELSVINISDEDTCGAVSDTLAAAGADDVSHPQHYREGTADMCDAIVDGLPAARAAALWNVLKYYERAGKKDDKQKDLAKANNYAFRAVYGKFRHEVEADGLGEV